MSRNWKWTCLFVAGALLLHACNEQDESAPNIDYGDAIAGLAMPVHLNYGRTRIPLADFVEFPEKVDSVYFGHEVDYNYLCDSGLVVINSFNANVMVTSMGLITGGLHYHIPIFKNQNQSFRFTYEPTREEVKEVGLKGSFNGWNHKANLLSKDDDVWVADLVLAPGLYSYLIVEDGREMRDRNNPQVKDNGQGGFNSAFRVGGEGSAPFISTYGFSGDSLVLHCPEELHNPLIIWENHQLDTAFYRRRGNRLALAVPAASANLERSHIRVYACNHEERSNDLLIPLANGSPVMDATALNRSDKHTYAMYFMMVDRFANGDTTNDFQVKDPDILPPANYYGGDLAGVLQKIEEGYFNALGTNTIWLSPITQNPLGAYGLWDEGGVRSTFSGYHGYWPISSSKVDFRFGNEGVLKELISTAHGREANVILDYVANHVHQEHPLYQQHPEWATELYLPDGRLNTELWDEQRLTTWFDTFMPTLDLENPKVVAAMTDSALFWFENYPLDGFRHDATKHVPLAFWRELTRKLKYQVAVPESRSIYQIGETYGNPELIGSYVGSGLLDGQFDFNLYDAAVAAFASDGAGFEELDRVINQSLTAYGYHNLMGNISGNQDRARFISYADGSVSFAEDAKLAGWTRRIEIKDEVGYDRLALLHALNFTLPGIPVIYYGDEIGMPGANDPDNRRMMRFGDDLEQREREMLETVTAIANLRKQNMALLYGDLQVLHLEGNTYAYCRNYFDKTALVVFNTSGEEVELRIEMPRHVNLVGISANFGHSYEVKDRTLIINMKPTSFEILSQ